MLTDKHFVENASTLHCQWRITEGLVHETYLQHIEHTMSTITSGNLLEFSWSWVIFVLTSTGQCSLQTCSSSVTWLTAGFLWYTKECQIVAIIARDDPWPLPGMHRNHSALPSQTDTGISR